MKKLFLAAIFLQAATFTFAQENDRDLKTWYHKDFASTKVYGVNTDNAYKFLESKGLKPKPVVVAVIDSGVEVDHPGLKANMWKNPNEVPNNGKDDDRNGYIDDVYGWNFLGGKNGDVDVDNLEVTRVVREFKPLFEGPNSSQNKANQAKYPENFQMYMKAKSLFESKGEEARQQYGQIKMIYDLIPNMVKMLNGKTFTEANVGSIRPATQQDAMAYAVMRNMVKDPSMAGKSSAEFEKAVREEIGEYLKETETQGAKQYNLEYDPRSIVGDNYADYSERYYGNNNYEGPDALHGTHVAGIIAGLPTRTEPQYGVASRVAKIMTVRAVPDGDERDKDVANAIRYAVDNGAMVLNMSFGKPLSPGKKYVWEAMKYAQDKGVLLVHAAGNDNVDIAAEENYPTNFASVTDAAPFVNNVITVGASTRDSQALRAGFSNYNLKMVDVFAPGNEIYSTVPDGQYRYLQGTSMASPVVAGAAALLKAYMPNLTPAQMIEALVNTSNKSTANAMLKGGEGSFDRISRAGGVIDVKKAAEYAYTRFYQGTTTPSKSLKPVKKVPPPRKAVRR